VPVCPTLCSLGLRPLRREGLIQMALGCTHCPPPAPFGLQTPAECRCEQLYCEGGRCDSLYCEEAVSCTVREAGVTACTGRQV